MKVPNMYGGDNEEAATTESSEDNANFFTPQHVPKESLCRDSRGSLDVFYDAFGTSGRSRQRHWSAGTSGAEVGPLGVGQVGDGELHSRIRHSSCCNNESAALLKDLKAPASLGCSPIKAVSKLGGPTNYSPLQDSKGYINYVPCVDMDFYQRTQGLASDGETTKSPSRTFPLGVAKNMKSLWRLNYVPVSDEVEGETELNPSRVAQLKADIQLAPVESKESGANVVSLYSFEKADVEDQPLGQSGSERRRRMQSELDASSFLLRHGLPHLFVSSQWQDFKKISCAYLGYRIFWALYFTMWSVWSLVGFYGYNVSLLVKRYYFLYLTNWGMWLLAVDTWLQTVNLVVHFKKVVDEGNASYRRMALRHKMSWFLSNINSTLHIFIAASYWITVFPYKERTDRMEITINTHLVTLVYILLDLAVSATPRRVLHAYQPMLFVFIYIIFNLFYFLCGGLNPNGEQFLYPAMNWTRPVLTFILMCLAIVVVVPLIHLLVCGLYCLRIRTWRVLRHSRNQSEDCDRRRFIKNTQEQNV